MRQWGWHIGRGEANTVAATKQKCTGFADCRRAEFSEIAAVAEHWGDHLVLGDDDHLTSFPDLVWRSADTLTAYSLKTEFQDSEHQSGRITGMTASRTRCNAASPPLPQDAPVGCRSLNSEFATKAKAITEATLKHDPWRMGTVEQAAKGALQEASRRWRIAPMERLRFTGCDKTMLYDGDKFSMCNWSDPQGMQRFSVQVEKFGALRHGKGWNTVPWVLSHGNGLACAEE